MSTTNRCPVAAVTESDVGTRSIGRTYREVSTERATERYTDDEEVRLEASNLENVGVL